MMVWMRVAAVASLGVGCGIGPFGDDEDEDAPACRLVDTAQVLYEDPVAFAGDVAIEGGMVYFASGRNDLTQDLYRVPLAGGPAELLADEPPSGSGLRDLTADGDGIYWLADDGLRRLVHGGGQSEEVLPFDDLVNYALAIPIGDDLLVHHGANRGFLRVPKGGGMPVEMLGGRIEVGTNAAWAGASVYVEITRDEDRPAVATALAEMNADGMTYRTLVEPDLDSSASKVVAADGERLYYFGYRGGQMSSIPVAGGEPTVILDGWPGYADDLHSDGTFLHFHDIQDTFVRAWRMPADGSAAPEAIGCEERGVGRPEIVHMAASPDGVVVSVRSAFDGEGMQILRL